MSSPKPSSDLMSMEVEDASLIGTATKRRGLLNLGQKLTDAANAVSKMTAIAGEVIHRTAASASELLADKELRRKGAQYLMAEGSKVVQELQKGVGQGVGVIGRSIQQGAAYAHKGMKKNAQRYATLMARLEKQIADYRLAEQLKERRQMPVDIQIGFEPPYEDVPQEIRSRLWYVLLQQPSVLKPFLDMQDIPEPVVAASNPSTAALRRSQDHPSFSSRSEHPGESRRTQEGLCPVPSREGLATFTSDRVLSSTISMKEISTGLAEATRELSEGIRDAFSKLSTSPAARQVAAQEFAESAAPPHSSLSTVPSSTLVASTTMSPSASRNDSVALTDPMDGLELAELKAATEAARRCARNFTAGIDSELSMDDEAGLHLAEALQALEAAAHTDPLRSPSPPDKGDMAVAPRTASATSTSPPAPLQGTSATSASSQHRSPGSDGGMDEWEMVADGGSSEQITAAVVEMRSRIISRPGLPRARQALVEELAAVPWPLPTDCDPDSKFAVFQDIVSGQEEVDEIITRDINRTFPEHPQFGVEAGQRALFRVLKAYSVQDLEVGYCQGMAFGAGVLLMYLPEEMAFRLFARLLECTGCNLRRMYLPGLEGLKTELGAFELLLDQHMPQLGTHLEEHGVPAVLYASQWFMTMFACPFPATFAARVLDIMLQANDDRIMLRLALSIMAQCCDELLRTDDFENIVTTLKVRPVQWGTAVMRTIFEVALKSEATDEHIEAARKQAALVGMRSMSRHPSRRAVRESSMSAVAGTDAAASQADDAGVAAAGREAASATDASPAAAAAALQEADQEESEDGSDDLGFGMEDILNLNLHPLSSLDPEHLRADAAIESVTIDAARK